MIGVEGQYYLEISIPDTNFIDFVDTTNIVKVVTECYAGGNLPILQVSFICYDNTILQYLHESSPLTIKFGVSDEDFFIANYRVLSKVLGLTNDDEMVVSFWSELDAIPYRQGSKVRIFERMSAVEAIFETVSEHFNIFTNLEKSEDYQPWIQNGISDKAFVERTVYRSYLEEDGVVGIAISSEGDFIIKNVIKDIENQEYDWSLTDSSTFIQNDELLVSALFPIKSRSGESNVFYGYETKTIDKDIEYMDYTQAEFVNTPITADSGYEMAITDSQLVKPSTLNDNVHKYYNVAYYKNLSKLALLSTIEVIVTRANSPYFPIKPFDTVIFLSETKNSPYLNGFYLVSKVERTIGSNGFFTTITLVKEAFNMIVTNDEQISYNEAN